MLIRTKEHYDYSTISDRYKTHDGCIVDVGCKGWDWFASIVGQKRIIGVDPFEEPKEGYELFQGVLAPTCGTVDIGFEGDECSIFGTTNIRRVYSLNWKMFCGVYKIDKVSVLKLNIEGAEYPLLHSMDTDDFEKIDQIAVSFHDWINPKWNNLTDCAMCLLEHNGFELAHEASQYGWHLYLKTQW